MSCTHDLDIALTKE